jgi:hypothetical protein
LQDGPEEEPESQATSSSGKTGGKRQRPVGPQQGPRPSTTQTEPVTYARVRPGPPTPTREKIRDERVRRRRDPAGGSKPADKTASEQDSNVNDKNETGGSSQPSSDPGAASPGSGQGRGGTQPDRPADGDADDPRRIAHELVAQAQALLHIASQDPVLPLWWPRGVPDISPAFPELALKAGLAQAEIASGRYDDALAANVGNPQGFFKSLLPRRLLVKIQDLVRTGAPGDVVKWLKTACGAISSVLGSMSFIPGVELIKEGIDLIKTGLETVEQNGGPTAGLSDKPSPRN